MDSTAKTREQKHPQERPDSLIVNRLLQSEASDYNLVELARLRIRYKNFPGAKALQTNLDKVLQIWQLTEEELFAKTREIHSKGQVYRKRGKGGDKEDWS